MQAQVNESTSAPLFGPVSDHWGRKKLMVLGLVIFGIGTAATGFGTSFPELLLFRAIAGLGGAITMPTIFALIGDLFPYQMRGKNSSAMYIRMLTATAISTALLATDGFIKVAVMCGISNLLVWPIIGFLVNEMERGKTP